MPKSWFSIFLRSAYTQGTPLGKCPPPCLPLLPDYHMNEYILNWFESWQYAVLMAKLVVVLYSKTIYCKTMYVVFYGINMIMILNFKVYQGHLLYLLIAFRSMQVRYTWEQTKSKTPNMPYSCPANRYVMFSQIMFYFQTPITDLLQRSA